MQQIDNNDLIKIEGRFALASKQLNEIAPEVAKARQVKEYNAEMRRNLLAHYMKPWLEKDIPSTKAETMARAEQGYLLEIQELADQLLSAEQSIAKHRAIETSWETARSMLSFTRESLRQFNG